MQIRQATVADLDRLVPLFDAYRVFYGQPSDPELARSFLRDRFEHLQSIVFLALARDRPLGFTQLYPSFSSARARRIFILNDLFVVAEARGRGVGRALLAAAAEHGKAVGAARLTLSTGVDNRTAQALYEAAGWTRDTAFVSYNLPLD